MKNDNSLKKIRGDNEKAKKALERFLDDIIGKKITNKQDLKKEYLEKIKNDKNKLEQKNSSQESNARRLINYANEAEYIILGSLLLGTDEQPDIDMPDLETEESTEQRINHQNKD